MLAAVVVLLRSIGLLGRGHQAVALENLALRQPLAALTRTGKRPQLRDRLCWILLRKSWRDWRGALLIVRPDKSVRWHRQWVRHRWTARSRQKRPGRPKTDAAIRALIDKMAAANPLWGAPRIHGELRKLGVEVSERTVSRFVRRRQRPPSQTWRTFLANHRSARTHRRHDGPSTRRKGQWSSSPKSADYTIDTSDVPRDVDGCQRSCKAA
jgi:putative transposase